MLSDTLLVNIFPPFYLSYGQTGQNQVPPFAKYDFVQNITFYLSAPPDRLTPLYARFCGLRGCKSFCRAGTVKVLCTECEMPAKGSGAMIRS